MNRVRADKWLLYALSALFLLTGASIWETVVFVPVWASGNPANLSVLQANAGIDSSLFWLICHSAFEGIFILTLIFNWNLKGRRTALLFFAALYAIIRIWTVVYFAPSFLEFQKLSSQAHIVGVLTERTLRWKELNYIRTALVGILNLAMLFCVRKMLSMTSDERHS